MSLLLRSQTHIIEVVGETEVGWRAVREVQMLRPDVVVTDCTTPRLSVLKANNVGLSVADTVSFDVQPVVGIRSLSFSRVKV